MTIWEKFIAQLTPQDKALMICKYYQNIKEGFAGSCCTNECPFKKREGLCKIYNKYTGKLISETKLDELLGNEVD